MKSFRPKKKDLDSEFAEFESLIESITDSKKEKQNEQENKKTNFKEIKSQKISAEPTYNLSSMLQPTNYTGEKRIKKPNFETEETSSSSSTLDNKAKKRTIRKIGDEKWTDESLAEWPENDYRIFVGNLGNDVNETLLSDTFSKYPSFAKAKIVRDKATSKSKGYGFVSYLDGEDFLKAIMEFDGKYIGSRPCKLKKSTWEDRNPDAQKKKKKKKFEFN